MSTNSNENKVILSDDLILLIFSFIENPFHNSIPLSFLFCSKKDYYIKKKKLYNIYCNLFHSCKKFYPLKYKDSYIIFNKKYSKKYNESEEFKKEVSNRINSQYLLTFSEFPEYDSEGNRVDFLVNSCNEKILLKKYIGVIDIFKDTYKEILIFMKLENTQVKKVSNVHIIFAINNYVKNEQNKNNPDIFVEGYDRRKRFRLIGDLKILFDFIKKQMSLRGHLENEQEFPEHISFINLIKYVRYCFPEH
jgi:hypothetical protein